MEEKTKRNIGKLEYIISIGGASAGLFLPFIPLAVVGLVGIVDGTYRMNYGKSVFAKFYGSIRRWYNPYYKL